MTRPAATDDPPLDDDAHPPTPPRRSTRWLKPLLLILTLVLIYVLVRTLDLEGYLTRTQDFIERLGPWGPLAFILIYIAATVAMIPAWPLTVLAGALFHWVAGTIYVSIASTIGAAICFLIARYVARDSVAAWVSKRRTFRKLNALTDQYGAWMVSITRLVPIFPYNLLNYAFGLTAVGFWTYVFWSWLCMLPWTAVYVVGTGAVMNFLIGRDISWPQVGIFAVLSAVVVLSTWFGQKQWKAAAARRRARRRGDEHEAGDASEGEVAP